MLPKYKVFLFLLLAFIIGIALASFIKIDFFICYVVFLISLVILFFGWKNEKLRIISLIFIFIIFGVVRYNLSWPKITPEKIQFYNNQKVVFRGLVKKVEERLDKKEIIIESNLLSVNDKTILVKGRVLVFTPLYSYYQYGDQLEISCQLNEPTPIKEFAYHEYLARYDIYSTCFPKEIKILAKNQGNFFMSQIIKIKNKIKLAIEKNFTEPEGTIFSALLLGLKKEVPQKIRETFSKTGTAHILAISGLHVMIMATLIMNFCIGILFLKRQDAFWLVSLMLIFYVILTGGAASAVRAGIMGFLLILAEKIGRKKESLNLIVFVASVMLCFNPKLLKNDAGFQLSFLGILGINYLSDYFYQIFKKIPETKFYFRKSLATTCSAQLFVFPLVLYYWGNLSLGAPIANIFVLFLLPYLMALGFIFAFGSSIFFFLSKILFFPIWLILFCLDRFLIILSQIPLFSLNFGKVPFFIVIILYLAIIYFVIQVNKIKNTNLIYHDV